MISAVCVCTLLTGCSFGSSIDTLMAPPKLSVQQEQIFSALTDAAGGSISLKYPKSGSYLSAFIVDDIDGDGGTEAVVFYEKTGLAVEENTLRINILDQFDGKWRSVCDTPAEGSEIEKVMISRLGSNNRINLLIGSSLINRSEKNVSVYNYDGGTIEQTFSSQYSFFDITDLDSDGESEFLLLAGQASGSPAVAEAYKLDEDGIYHKYSLELSGSFSEYEKITYGSLSGGRKGLYIDAQSGSGLIQTDVLFMNEKGLGKVFDTPEKSLATVRPQGCSLLDIDSDGTPEIPVQTVAPGYSEVSEGEQMKLTSWLTVCEDDSLERKYTSYYSVNDGYIFVFPNRWYNRVTVRRDSVNDELVFCEFSGNKVGRELFRICCARDTASLQDRLSNGYMLLRTKGELTYLGFIPTNKGNDGLDLSAGDAAVGFRYRD